jgi:hypothetical protein
MLKERNNAAALLTGIIDATVNHHVTIAVEPAPDGYSVTILMLGYDRTIDCRDLNSAIDEASAFIAEVIATDDVLI